MTRREILENFVSYLNYRKNVSPNNFEVYKKEKIDQALAELEKLDLGEEELEELLSQDPLKLWIIAQDYKSLAQAILSATRRKRGER